MSEKYCQVLMKAVNTGEGIDLKSVGAWNTKKELTDYLKDEIRRKYADGGSLVVDLQEQMEDDIFHGDKWQESDSVQWLTFKTLVH